MKISVRERMEELKLLKSERSTWEGYRRLMVGLSEQRCIRAF